MLESIYAQALIFFLLLDPIGNVPVFLSVLRGVPPKRVKKIIFRELVIALGFILFFFLVGESILKAMDIQEYTLKISGGVILFLIAIRMIFNDETPAQEKEVITEPFIVPLAVPMIAGPAVLAAIMVFSENPELKSVLLISIFLAWIITTLILLLACPLSKLLGEKGLLALEKLMGLILTLLAVQLFLDGFYSFFNS